MACSAPRHTYDSVILGFDGEVMVHIHSLGIFWGKDETFPVRQMNMPWWERS